MSQINWRSVLTQYNKDKRPVKIVIIRKHEALDFAIHDGQPRSYVERYNKGVPVIVKVCPIDKILKRIEARTRMLAKVS